jgi:hypothetical protein
MWKDGAKQATYVGISLRDPSYAGPLWIGRPKANLS